MIRIANGRRGPLADAAASLTLMRTSRDGGAVVRQMHELLCMAAMPLDC